MSFLLGLVTKDREMKGLEESNPPSDLVEFLEIFQINVSFDININ
jgi:hypothetical protein